MTQRIYLGSVDAATYDWRIFKADATPTQESHGHLYNAVIGPFRTMRGARFMKIYGRSNPHLQTVADAERIAKQLDPRAWHTLSEAEAEAKRLGFRS